MKKPKVTGIGGIFFKTKNLQESQEWYQKNLGIDAGPYGANFKSRNIDSPDEINILNWSLFKDDTTYLEPSAKDFMINYRVQNLEGLIDQLKKNGVTIVDKMETYDYGKFIHIMDNDGNKIELWEPNDSGLE